MFSCFKKKDRGPEVKTPPKAEVDSREFKMVIFIPGHTKKGSGRSRGMGIYNGTGENDFNTAVLKDLYVRIKADPIYKTLPIDLLYRHEDSYSTYCRKIKTRIKESCKRHNISLKDTLVIELHLNAAGIPSARGGEALVMDHKSAITAYPMIHAFCDQFDIKMRRSYTYREEHEDVTLRGIKFLKSGSRGSGFLKTVKSLGCTGMLWEPFFADYRTSESKIFFDDMDKGVSLMSDFWIKRLEILNK